MNKVKVASASINTIPLDWHGNKTKILKVITEAKKEGVAFLCLPELCVSGYGCEDAFFYSYMHDKALSITREIANQTKDIVVTVGLPFVVNNALYDCVAVLLNGKILGIVPKKNLSSDGVHYEKRWFKEWESGHSCTVGEICFGDLVFDFDGVRLGFEICEDAWVAGRPGIELAKRGVNLIFNPSASHFAFDKHKIREAFITEGSRAFRCVYVYSNLVGNESGRIIFGGDTFIAQNGRILSNGGFTFNDFEMISSVVDIDDSKTHQIQTASFKPVQKDDNCLFFSSFWEEPAYSNKKQTYDHGDKFTQFENALTLGLYDYMKKSHSSGYVVSLSGGVDSAACAILVYLMVQKVKEKDMLTCVYQKTKNSSEKTEKLAQYLASSIFANYHCVDVDALVSSYTEMSEQIVGRDLSWEKDDIALQNIQARVRAPSVWMVANIKNAILISTSNRSEAAVGYATLDGDTCGGLSPIAGVDKKFLTDWLRDFSGRTNQYLSKSIHDILCKKPTAELRPLDNHQNDEDDLMPYVYLDFIERAAIHNKKSPKEVLSVLDDLQPGKHVVHKSYVKKFFQLWARNQYKRERYAVSFHLDDANLDPKSWCRFPVLNSGFMEELEKL